MNNRKRLKKLILANKETRWLYRMMQFLAIFMIVSCLVVITTAKWIEYDQNKKREELFGSWDEVFLNVDQDDLNYFRKNAFLEQISVQSIQEKVFLEEDQRVVIGACDENFLEMGNIELLEGRMPKHEKEVAVEEEYMDILDVSKIGDTILTNDVWQLKGYKVTGILENYSNSWSEINPNISYPNCFVKYNSVFKELRVFVEYGSYAIKDPEINMLFYEENINNQIVADFSILGKALCVYMIMSIVVMFFLKRKLCPLFFAKRGKEKYKNNKKLDNIIVIVISFFVSVAAMKVINEVVFQEGTMQYINNYYNNVFKNDNLDIVYKTGKNMIGIIDDSNKIDVMFHLNFIVVESLNIMWFIINITILYYVIMKFVKNNSSINSKVIERYYYNSSKMILSSKSKLQFFLLWFIGVTLSQILFIYKYRILDYTILLTLSLLYFLVGLLIIIVVFILIKFFLRKVASNIV